MECVVLENVSKSFIDPRQKPVQAVRNLSFSLRERELLAVVGPSGSGKTTLLRLIAGLEEPSSGAIHLNGRPVNRVPPHERDVAMIFQHHALYPHMTAFENLAFGLKLRKVPRGEIEQRVRETAELLGIVPLLHRRPEALSGGERQRVALGRALVRRPRLLLLDEPLSNLDAPLRAQMRQELLRLHSQLDMAMIFVTHDQAEALALGQRVAVLHAGGLQQIGAPEELLQRPANLFVAGFIGSPPMNLLRGRLVRGARQWGFELAGASPGKILIPLPEVLASEFEELESKDLVLGVRAEEIIGGAANRADEPAAVENPANRFGTDASSCQGQAFPADVEFIERLGVFTLLHARAAGQPLVACLEKKFTAGAGDPISLRISAERLRWFDPGTQRALING